MGNWDRVKSSTPLKLHSLYISIRIHIGVHLTHTFRTFQLIVKWVASTVLGVKIHRGVRHTLGFEDLPAGCENPPVP